MKEFFAISILLILKKELRKDKHYGYQCELAIQKGIDAFKKKLVLKNKLRKRDMQIKDLKEESQRLKNIISEDLTEKGCIERKLEYCIKRYPSIEEDLINV